MRTLLAGDSFVRNDLLAGALADVLPADQLRELTVPWPEVPFRPVAEVDEACGDEDELLASLDGVEVVITQMAPLTERVLDGTSALRLIVCTRGGPVNINVEAASERGIAVSSAPGRNAVAAAEYSLLLMLASMRRLTEAHAALAAGDWRTDMYAYDGCGAELAGATVGIVGLGQIGRRVAALVRAMGATVVGHDPMLLPQEVDVELLSLDALLARADVVSLHARLTPETRGMVGARELALMRPGSVLVNTARGDLMDYEAAAAALASGPLEVLALDVFASEPLPASSPLLTLPGVVLSPHLAGATRQTAERAAAMAAAEVRRYRDGQPLAHPVNGVQLGASS